MQSFVVVLGWQGARPDANAIPRVDKADEFVELFESEYAGRAYKGKALLNRLGDCAELLKSMIHVFTLVNELR